MKKQIIRVQVFEKHYDGLITGFPFSDIPTNTLPTDIIDLEKEEGYYSENNSWDDSSRLVIYREREETDEELEIRKEKNNKLSDELKKRRFEQYQKLKKEFEDL